MIRNQIRPAIAGTLVLMVITGALYPAVVTGLAQTIFPRQANGSLVQMDGRVVGSELIGQPFAGPAYFHPRPSAAGSGYDATASAGTNKGPTDLKLSDTLIAQSVADAAANDGARPGRVPADMATRSASGLDPHISPANAAMQTARVSRARGVDARRVADLVARHTEGRTLGFLGEPRVNVLLLNLALDRELGRAAGRRGGRSVGRGTAAARFRGALSPDQPFARSSQRRSTPPPTPGEGWREVRDCGAPTAGRFGHGRAKGGVTRLLPLPLAGEDRRGTSQVRAPADAA